MKSNRKDKSMKRVELRSGHTILDGAGATIEI